MLRVGGAVGTFTGDFTSATPNAGGHPGMSSSGFRQNRTTYALQIGVGASGAFADIDIGNPRRGFGIGAAIHAVELMTPGATDPFRVGRALGSEITGYTCR